MSAAVKGAAVGAVVAASYFDITMPYLGVPLNVVMSAVLGAFAGLAWSDGVASRRVVFQIALGSVVVACALTGFIVPVVAHFMRWQLDVKQLAPLALLISFFGKRWVPAVNERIGPWLDKLPFIGKKGG